MICRVPLYFYSLLIFFPPLSLFSPLSLSLSLFYNIEDLNNLDWGPNNILVVALGSTVYLWNATENNVDQLMQLHDEDLYVSSVAWADTGKYLAIGISNGNIQVCVCVCVCASVHVCVCVL